MALPLPFRPDPFSIPVRDVAFTPYIPRRHRSLVTQPRQFEQHQDQGELLRKLRDDARHYKNVTLKLMELPATPLVSNVRRLSNASRPQSKRSHVIKGREEGEQI